MCSIKKYGISTLKYVKLSYFICTYRGNPMWLPMNGEDVVVLKGNHEGYPYGIQNNGFDKIINNQYSSKIHQIKG
jgi:hypothetical protein